MKIKLRQAFDLQMGKTPARNRPDYWNGDHKWISIADIGNAGKFLTKTKESITAAGIDGSGIKVVPPRNSHNELQIINRKDRHHI